MTESEKFEQQGRARAELKEAKSNAAALRAGLLSYSKGLEEANLFLKRFLSDPLAEGANHLPISEHLKADFRSIRPVHLIGMSINWWPRLRERKSSSSKSITSKPRTGLSRQDALLADYQVR